MKTIVTILALLCVVLPAAGQSPQNIVVVLDNSGSMGDGLRSNRNVSKIDAAKQALNKVLSDLPPNTNVGVILLNKTKGMNNYWLIPFGPLNKPGLKNAIDPLQPINGTPLGVRMKEAADVLLAQRAKQPYGFYRFLIISDGEAGDPEVVKSNLFGPNGILVRGWTVDVIGVDMSESHSLATQVHSYRKADDAKGLITAMSEVLAESAVNPAKDVSDYDLIQPLPNELVGKVITALSETVSNQPIGEARPVRETLVFTSPSDALAAANAKVAAASEPGISFGTGLLIVLGCIVGIIVIVVIIVAIIEKVRESRYY